MADLSRAQTPRSPSPWDGRHIERRLLALGNRRRIVDHVTDRPGVHLRQVARDLGLALGTTEHHLHVLVRHGLLEVGQSQGQSCFFPPGMPDHDQLWWAVLRQGSKRQVLRVLAADPDLDAAGLARRLGLSKAAVAYHLQHLEAWGFVERLRVGRQRLLRVAHPEALADRIALLDDERPVLPWPGLLMTGTRTGSVRGRSNDRTPRVEVVSADEADAERAEAHIRSSSP
ncbi:MAG: winged helix-turn-helix transcriptional regulator [Thermoplasmatota archaeon]